MLVVDVASCSIDLALVLVVVLVHTYSLESLELFDLGGLWNLYRDMGVL